MTRDRATTVRESWSFSCGGLTRTGLRPGRIASARYQYRQRSLGRAAPYICRTPGLIVSSHTSSCPTLGGVGRWALAVGRRAAPKHESVATRKAGLWQLGVECWAL